MVSQSAARNRSKHGKLRGFGFSNTIERAAGPGYEGAEIRFDRSGSITLFSGSNNQGQGHETAFKQIVCDRLGVDPKDITYVSGDTDTVFFGEGTGGSRSAATGGSAVAAAADKIIDKGEADRRACAQGRRRRSEIRRRHVLVAEDQPDRHHRRRRPHRRQSGETAEGHGTGPDRRPRSSTWRTRTSRTAPMSARSRSTRTPAMVEIVRYSVVDDVGIVINPLLVYGQITGGVAQGIGQILMEDIHFDPESGQLVTGSFMDYAMPRADRHQRRSQFDSNPVPTQDQSARRQGLRRGRLRRRHAGGRQRHRRCALGLRHPPHRDAGNAGAGLARDPGGEAAGGGVRPIRALA